jgi:hypothetical protein
MFTDIVGFRAVCIRMEPRPYSAQPERNAAKSKASPLPLRLRHSRGYAQSERDNQQGLIREKVAIAVRWVRMKPILCSCWPCTTRSSDRQLPRIMARSSTARRDNQNMHAVLVDTSAWMHSKIGATATSCSRPLSSAPQAGTYTTVYYKLCPG